MKLVLLFLVCFLYSACAQSSLEQIKDKIIQTGLIDAQSIGPQLASYLPIALGNLTTSIPATNITYNITSNSLTIFCVSKIWGNLVDADFYFVLDSSNDIEVSFLFSVSGSAQNLYELITNGKQIPNALNDLSANGTWSISFSSGSSSPLPVQKGITISGSAQIVAGVLLDLAHHFNPKSIIQVTASLYIPVFSENPEYVTLVTKLAGDYILSNTLDATALTFTVNVPTNILVSLNLQATLTEPSKQKEILFFTVSGEYIANQDELVLQGDMVGTWAHPLDLHWLTLTSAEGKLTIQNSTPVLSVTANGDVTFSSSPVEIIITFDGPLFEDILIEMTNIDVSKKLDGIYGDVTGKSGPSLAQVNVAGTASVAISTYDGQNFKEGFSIVVDATLTEGNLMKASRILNSSATPSTFQYTATLYIPIFTNLAVDFSLVESTPFPVSAHMTCKDYSLIVDVSSDSEVTIKGDFVVVTKDGQNLQVTMTGDWQEDSEEVTFTGNLNNPWTHPFKLNWLILDTAQVQFVLGGSLEVQLTFQGTATLSFDTQGPVNVIASIGGPDLTDALFSISGLPIEESNTLDSICYYLLGMSVPPSIIKSLHPKGTATVSISTYDSQYAQQGFTLLAVVNLDSSGELYKVARHFSANPTAIDFNMKLYIDVFGSSPMLEFQLMENGGFNYEKNVVVNSYGIDVIVSESPSISVNADFAVTFKHQPDPINFDVSANWQDGTSFTLSGSMTGVLTHPFGCNWLNITSLAASITLSAPVGLQSLSFSGASEFHFGTDTGTASVSLDMSDDFADTTLSMTVNNKWTLVEMASTMLGKEPADLVKDVESQAALSLSITISTMSGITLDVSGQVTGDLQNSVKKVCYWWRKDISNVTFDVALGLPIFSADPMGISLTLDFAEEIQISKTIWFESIAFSIAAVPFSISLDTRVKAEWKKNPTLFFEVSGAFKESGEVLLWGAMEGTWDNAFDIKGFSLSNVIIEFGLDPAMCAVDFCISDIGLGLQMPLGSKMIKFDGNLAAPDYLDIFLSGTIIDKKMDLDVLDVISDWNKINPTQPVSTKLIPPTWGVYEVSFYFAPEDGQFGPIHYTAGFGVTGGIILLDMPLLLSLNCTDAAGFSCNFAFNVDISISQFTAMIKKELHLLYPDRDPSQFDIFSVKDAQLTEWSQKNVAQGVHPRWNLDIVVWNKPHVMDFRVEQYQLAGSFHDFFVQFLKHIF